MKMEYLIRRLRNDIGDRMELMVDSYLFWDIEFTLRVAEQVRDFDVKWFEDPLPNGWATGGNQFLRDKLAPIQLGTGNLEFHYKALAEIYAVCNTIV